MYIVKISYLGCDWKWQKDITQPICLEVAQKISELNARYFLDLLNSKIIKDFHIEIIEENK